MYFFPETNLECCIQRHFTRTVHFLLRVCICTPFQFGASCNITKDPTKNKQALSESYSAKIFSIRKQLFDMLDIE